MSFDAAAGVLPVANFNIDYNSEMERITDFLSRYVKERARPNRRRGQAEAEIPSDDDDAAEDDLVENADDLDMDGGASRSKAKYMKVLRKVANRQTSEVVVDLADLKKVRDRNYLMCSC